ncbi:alpha/beta hydrolase [Nannocystis pusilla]|uniref:alpha/beta hydrolase n=1 Tax=Nannocystis pusilla TaxID=889268 RepID=UPI003B761AA1
MGHFVGAALALLFAAGACDGEPGDDVKTNEPVDVGDSVVDELAARCPGAKSEPIVLATPTGDIEGSLLLPAGCSPFEVVLIHAGSGPTDRDGNSVNMVNDALKLLAEGLAERGVATVRFDKRGVAASTAAGPASERDLRLETYADDAAAWVELLAEDERFRGVTIAGHSEGALIGMLAAQRSPAVAFVSLAGPERPAAELLREQLAVRLRGRCSPRPTRSSTRSRSETRWPTCRPSSTTSSGPACSRISCRGSRTIRRRSSRDSRCRARSSRAPRTSRWASSTRSDCPRRPRNRR